MGVLSAFFDVVAGVSILAGRSSLLDTRLTSVAGKNLTIRTLLGLGFFGIGFVNILATSRRQKKIDRLAKGSETFGAEYCEECSYMEHDACPMIEGCPCCDNTRQGMMGAETFGAEYCEECSYMEHDACPLIEGCPCCDNTRQGMMGAESFAADGRDMTLEEIEETYGDGRLCHHCFDGTFERGTHDDGSTYYRCWKCKQFEAESFEEWSQPCHCGEGTLRQEGDEDDLWVVIWCDTCSFSQDIKMKEAESFEAQSVMRTYEGRKGPAISAKAVRVGTRKRGNDGRMWQVRRAGKTQRWFRD